MSDEDQDFDVFPVQLSKDLILDSIRQNQIFICVSETGSGKTTQIPQYCLDEGLLGSSGLICITQPRRVAAITVAHRVNEERKGQLGVEVGYTVRFDDKTTRGTRIKYMTDGILLRECLSDALLSQYKIIMLDEAHERSINTDILFGLVKLACTKRSDLRVIVTSATLDIEKFSSYFNHCPVVRIPGRMYPVDIYHSKLRQIMTASGPANFEYIQSAVDSVLNIHRQDDEGHILVFLTGQEEVEKTCSLIREALKEDHIEDLVRRPLIVLPLYSALPVDQQKLVFRKVETLQSLITSSSSSSSDKSKGIKSSSVDSIPMKSPRKCIVATNIAETSITVPHVRYVVDCGYCKQKTFDPMRAMESLVVVPISQVSSDQRAGRAGRTAPGVCYRLYSSLCYENMMPETVPEILRSNLSNTVLYLKALGIVDVLHFDFIESPAADQVIEALIELHMLQAIDEQGVITPIGKLMSKLPLEPQIARMLITASEIGCTSPMVTIAAMLSTESIFIRPVKKIKESTNSNNTQSTTAVGDQKQMMTSSSSSKSYSLQYKQDVSSTLSRYQVMNQSKYAEPDNLAELAHSRLCHPMGDFHTLLNIYDAYIQAGYNRSNNSNSNSNSNNRPYSTFSSGSNSKYNDRSTSTSFDERNQYNWCRENYINHRSMKNAIRIRDQLKSEVRILPSQKSSDSNVTRTSTSKHSQYSAEDSKIMECILSGLYKKAGRVCMGNDTVYRSLPYYKIINIAEKKSSNHNTNKNDKNKKNSDNTDHANGDKGVDKERDEGEEEGDIENLKVEEGGDVMLFHPHAASALSMSTHTLPEYIVYQNLVFGGKLTIQNVCAVDYKLLSQIRASYKPCQPLQLCGYKPRKNAILVNNNNNNNNNSTNSMKRKIDDSDLTQLDTGTQGQTRISSTTIADTPIPTAVSATSTSSVDAARERFLARKMKK